MVLIASKDEESVGSLAASLEGAGCRLEIARTDAEIFEKLSEEYPDFLVLDIETTDLKPASLVSILRYIAPSLKVIALTGCSTLEDAAVIEKGVFYYTSKPVGSELVELIQKGIILDFQKKGGVC